MAKSRTQQDQSTLSQRDLEILRDVIFTHVLSAEPVSSRTVARYGGSDLSPASIRNVMADLEELGYLSQPHTSAGRVPTNAGYHLFIDELMRKRRVPARQRRYIEETLKEGAGDAEQLMTVASHLLSELSHQASIIMTPALGQTVLKTIDFVPLSERKVLCVVVSTGGFVDNKLLETDEPLPREQLVRISNYLTENYAGLTLVEIRDRLLAMMAEERAQMDQLLAQALELARKGLDPSEEQDVLVDGTSLLLGHPELADVARIRRLLDTFTDKARLVSMLSECIKGEGVRVLIGEDSDLTSELDLSLVATSYGSEEQGMGALGIFGPSRMEYHRVIPLVHYLGETLSRALIDGFSSQHEHETER